MRPVLIARSTNLDPIQNELTQYVGTKYKLNWWFPEDYKEFATDGIGVNVGTHRVGLPGLRLDGIARTLSDPDNRVKLLKFLVYRQAPNDMGAREMYFYVHKEIPALGPAPLGGPAIGTAPAPNLAPVPAQRDAIAQSLPDGTTVYGRASDGRPVLVDPKNAAVGPDGRIYVVEGRASRVSSFNPDGTLAGSWGSPGAGDGQFNEPWGIAVAPNGDVYVADTWNHRIQRFDANGAFLGKWGRLGDAKGSVTSDPGVFWGPRSIAISPQAEVYVSDTGNKRIQVFTPDGTFGRMFGGDGSDAGQFHEDTGITFDSQGNLWVADAWNRRVQEVDQTGKPLAQFPISSGWESQSITNKPYIAVNAQGQIVVTMPDQGKTATYSREGQLIAQTQLPGAGTPVGVTLGSGGKLLFADARNNVVVQLP